MTESKIIMHLTEKANEFVKILPKDLAFDFIDEMYFAGGCIYSLANGKEPKDYDIFLKSDKLIPKLKELDCWVCKTDNALSYGKFQVIIKFYGEPEEVVGQFDFKHNMHWFDIADERVCICCGYEEEIENSTSSLDDYIYIHTNELIFNEKRARDCENVWLRIDKFIKRGMKISKETKKKILSKTSKKEIKKARKSHRSGRSGRSGGGHY